MVFFFPFILPMAYKIFGLNNEDVLVFSLLFSELLVIFNFSNAVLVSFSVES